MGRHNMSEKTYEQYVESGCWRCDKSPTGAHHSIEIKGGRFYCKYCFDVEKFITVFNADWKIGDNRKRRSKVYKESRKVEGNYKGAEHKEIEEETEC